MDSSEQNGKKFARTGVQILLVLLNQDFRPGVEKAWKLLECQLKDLLRASQEQIECTIECTIESQLVSLK